MGDPSGERYPRIYAVVRAHPVWPGCDLRPGGGPRGLPGQARQVGYALHSLPEGSEVPWQRVINARGEVSLRSEAGWEHYQRHLLEEEGVVFKDSGRVDLDRYRWEPVLRTPRSR